MRRRLPALKATEQILKEHDWHGTVVYSVASAGDSGEGCDTILFKTQGGALKTGFLETNRETKKRSLTVRDGW